MDKEDGVEPSTWCTIRNTFMTSRNIIFHAATVGALLPIGLWAAAEMALPDIDSTFSVAADRGSMLNAPLNARLPYLPNLTQGNLGFCMILMIACSLAVPAGRSRFTGVRSLVIIATATLTCLVAVVHLAMLAAPGVSDAPIRMAALAIEAMLGGLVLLTVGIAWYQESRGTETDPSHFDAQAQSILQLQSLTVGRFSSQRPSSPIPSSRHLRLVPGCNRSHTTP